MTPMTSAEGIHAELEVVAPIVLVAMLVVLVAILVRKLGFDVVDELADLWRTYGPVATRRALDHRPNLATTPWFCDRCRSCNAVAARACYKCGARREEAEAAIPEGAELPAGPSAGLNQRTRQKG